MTFNKISDTILEESVISKRIFDKNELLMEKKDLQNRIKEIDLILLEFEK